MKNLIENLSAKIAFQISKYLFKLIEDKFEYLFVNKVFEVVKVSINPQDTIILKYKMVLSREAYERLKDSLQPYFPNNKILIFEDGLDLTVVTSE